MTLTLNVDGERWRAHLRSVLEDNPDVVPVIKGNGYGFGNTLLAGEARSLAAETVAVGTYPELDDVAGRYDGDIVVLTPWRPFGSEWAPAISPRLIHTVSRIEDLRTLLSRPDQEIRVLLERATSMLRHGFTARGLREAAALIAATPESNLRVEGASIHLPLEGPDGGLAEADAALTDIVSAGLVTAGERGPAQVWVSHVSASALADLSTRYPEFRFRPRVGTGLWLGDRGALSVTAHVLDVHPVDRGETFGYRGRTIHRSGTIVVVSGGTANGIGLEAPTGEVDLRARAGSLARGGLDAIGQAKSPYTIAGKARYFAEPPHMQSSMVFLPSGAEAPSVGDEVEVRVRYTATTVEDVQISGGPVHDGE